MPCQRRMHMNVIDFLPGDVVYDREHPRILGLVTEVTHRGPSVVWEHGGRASWAGLVFALRHYEPRWRFQVPRDVFHDAVQIRELVVSTALRDAGLSLGMRKGWIMDYQQLGKAHGLMTAPAATCSACALQSKLGVTERSTDIKAKGQLFLRALTPRELEGIRSIGQQSPLVVESILREDNELRRHPAVLAGCTDFWMCITCGSWMEATPLQVQVRNGQADRHDRSELG